MKQGSLFLVLGIMMAFFISCENETNRFKNDIPTEQSIENTDQKSHYGNQEYFLVANRGASTISVFNAKTTDYITDIALPDLGAQPTYLAHSKRNNAIYVGDFANKKIVYYDARSFALKGEIAIEEGAFHLWINNRVNQLWVNNIVSKATSVIDLNSNTVIKTLPLPKDEIPELTENAVQHDVTISPSGYAAYVTILDGPKSYVVMYATHNQKYIKHEVVGGDAHLLPVGTKLYVPAQEENKITVFSRFNLEKLGEIPFSSTHGVAHSRRFVFTTGIADNKVGVIDRYTNTIVSEINTNYNVPHNLATNRKGNILFLSHSGGSATQVVFYKVKRNGTLQKISEYDSGLNPFGVLRY
ncbi:YncE family protein [Aquimarina sediminis]|uniref:YncE family protein n=1 Tax=Aquimarina sediminis TaxID=2070536 RepID=UPI000CA00C46|nr:hypothetical protein [Aquimarina sediminis]